MSSAQFSQGGTHIATASGDDTTRVWNILPPTAGALPEWFPDFPRYIAQMRLNADGELETLKLDDWLALQERMRAVPRASAGQDTPCGGSRQGSLTRARNAGDGLLSRQDFSE